MFEWKSDYSVGIGSIDAQHQKLFAIARELYAAMSAGQGKASLSRVLDRLVQYTAVHFAHEERLMRVNDYPGFQQHKAQHDALTKQVLSFQADFEGAGVDDGAAAPVPEGLAGEPHSSLGWRVCAVPETKVRSLT